MSGGAGLNIGHPGGGGGMLEAHTNGARPSTEGKHQLGAARTDTDNLKKEKGDIRRQQAENARKAKKTGQSTRDPDGSLKRASSRTW